MRTTFGLAMLAVVTLSASSRAVVPGGSGPRADCYSEFDGITATNGGGLPARVECTDGDPACDTDGVCGNDFCEFQVRLCVNQHDPDIPICTPPSGGLTSLKALPSFVGDDLTSGIDFRSSACGAFVGLPVQVRRAQNGAPRPGRFHLRVTARAHATPSTDKDLVILVCNPRPPTDECPTPNGTTTTTTTPEPTTSTVPTSTSTTLPSTTTTTVLSTTTSTTATTTTATSSTSSTTTVPPTTTTSTVQTSSTTTTTSTTASTSSTTMVPTTTTSTTAVSITTTSSTTIVPTTTTTTTTTTTSSTTTTVPGLTACPAGGKVDVITNLVPNANTFNSNRVLGLQVEITYPSSVSMPGTMFLPVNDPADPTTLIALLSNNPAGIDLYDGSTTFFDADAAAPFKLKTLLTLDPQTSNLIFSQPVPYERARFTCTPAAPLDAVDFPCVVTSEVDVISRTIPPDQRPDCVVTLQP